MLCSQARLNPRFIYLDEGLPLETSVLETLNGGQFTSVISSVDKNYLLLIKGKLADIFLEYKHFSLNVSYPAFLFLIINYYSTHFHSFIYSFFTHLSVFFHLLFHLLQDIRAGTFQHELGISR